MLLTTLKRGWAKACLCVPTLLLALDGAAAESPLTLEEASRRALARHPRLEIFEWRSTELAGQRQSAALAPPTTLSLEAENVLGSGDLNGAEGAELTLALSSVIELGGKAAARVAVVDARMALAGATRQSEALDLLGEVTRRFLAAQALQARLEVAADARELARGALAQVRSQVQRGAAPRVEQLRAEAALAQAELQHTAIAAELQSSRVAIASLWGAEQVDFGPLRGDLFRFAAVEPFEQLYQRAVDSPAIRVLGAERRVRDAELELARTRSRWDIGWSAGVRRFRETGDSALTFGLNLPLFNASRNEGEVQAAAAARSAVDYRRQADLQDLRAQLFRAWQTYRQSSAAALTLRDDVLPLLQATLEETGEAYTMGRYRYLDWVDARRTLLDTRLAMIDAASNALLNLALIEQLTGSAALSPPAASRS